MRIIWQCALCLAIAHANLSPINGQQAILALSDSISRPGQVCAITAETPFEPQQTYYVSFDNKSVKLRGCIGSSR